MKIRVDPTPDGPRVHLDLDDPALRLTSAQRAAVAARTEQVLTAGAGAGKTHTLSLRYVALLLELAAGGEADVDRVLVLTFTERAAEEMAERCHHRLLGLLDAARSIAPELDAVQPDDRPGSRLVTGLCAMADRFDGARIGTFHGFCASIVREFPAAARTPPGMRVLEEAEARQLRREVLDGALRTLVRDDPGVLGPLLDTFGSRHQLLEAGALALERRGVLAPILADHAAGRITVQAAQSSAAIPADDARHWVAHTGRPVLDAIRRLVAPSGGGRFVHRVVRPLLEQLDAGDSDDDLVAFARYRAVLSSMITDAGTARSLVHHSVLGVRRSWPAERHHGLAKQALGALQLRLDDWPERERAARMLPTPADRVLYAALTPFAAWVQQAATALDARFDADRCLSFDALQDRAIAAVLGDPDLRETLRARHRYVMVDEFQDTDERQWQLVHALGRAHPDVPEDRLFLVGDVKQAIYGFRGGDVTVFQRATEHLAIHGSGATVARLPENFRSRPELIGWFNEVFPSVLGAVGDVPRHAPYEPLAAGRTEAGGQVALLRGRREELGPDWQAPAVARFLATEWLRPGSPWHDRDRFPTPPVAILLRARTHQAAWEAALREQRVPFVVAQGIGFWTRPEVIDVVNALSALVHGDPVSLAGTLRGPWLGLVDQDLQDLHLGRHGGGGLHRFGTAPLSADAPPPIRRAHALVRDRRARLRREPPAQMVAVLAADHAPSRALIDPTGQADANLALLIGRVARWNADGIDVVADRLLAEVEAGERESEAVIVPTAARVVLCTVHAAKGLEFEGVVVPEADARPRRRPPALLVARHGPEQRWRMAARVLDPDAEVQTRVRPGLYSALQQSRRAEEAAEEQRLLYVAATRARESLLLVGHDAKPPSPGANPSWMQAITAHLPASTVRLDPVRILRAALPRREAAPPVAGSARTAPAPPQRRHRLELLASALDRFVGCPARWYRGDLLGVQEAPATAIGRAERLAAARGQLLHQLLEDPVAPEPDHVAARWRAAVTQVGGTPEEHDTGLQRVRAHLAACSADPELDRILAAPGFAEVPFRAEHAGVVLQGRIDRLYRDPRGWIVLDFKSEALGGRDPAQVAGAHAGQLLAYGWAAHQALGTEGPVVGGQVYLTEIGRSVDLGPWSEAALQTVPDLLDGVARVASMPWRRVEDDAVQGRVARPCAHCGFRGRGCRGQSTP